MPTRISGVQCLVMTPFTAQDKLDEEGLCSGIDFALDGGADGIVVIGRIGEYYGLSMEERKRVIEVAQAHVRGRAPLGFGIIDATYNEGLELARHGAKVGVDFVLSRGATDRKPLEYFMAVSAELPTMIYDFAENRELSTEEVLPVLEQCSNLVAVKVSGTADKIPELRKHSDLPLLCGWDTMSFLAYRLGSNGVVSGSAAVIPKHEVELYQLCSANKWNEAADLFLGRILPCINSCVDDPYGSAACKQVLVWQGVLKHSSARRPFRSLNEVRRAELRRVLEWTGVLK